jgi:2,4-dienoyl-CoA reductase-like NADH-dependent reductase (Old Yellow Enzyme family)
MAYLLRQLHSGSLSLANRLVMPPMATAKADSDGKVSRKILDYYNEKSQGGYISLIIIEHSYISQAGKASHNQLSVGNNNVIEGLRELADVIHGNGSKTIIQINHAGSNTSREIIGDIPVAPSAVVNPRQDHIPRELTRQEIADIIKAFQDAALRVQEAGFDGVELHSAHGYLLNQFLSPITNKRTDEYGGDILNRIHLHIQVIKAVRTAVGKDFPILLRLGVSDFIPGGTTIEDIKTAAQAFEEVGINILDISGGLRGWNIPELTGQGFLAPFSEAIKKVVSIPVIVTGGITEVQAAEQLLAEGKADLIGVGRAILQDSHWAQKAIEILS